MNHLAIKTNKTASAPRRQ